MDEWIERDAALALLGVKAQTLYAYVSRGKIEVRRGEQGTRRNLYRAEDVARLASHADASRKPIDIAARSMAWGEASLVTRISTVRHGRLIYRGEDAVHYATHATLEDTARLLWACDGPLDFLVPALSPANPFEALASLAAQGQPALGRGQERLRRDTCEAIAHLAASCGLRQGTAPLHEGLAEHWELNSVARDCIRQALVLMADHELNASTFACRVAASTGAPVAASLLAGLCALSGPRHGGSAKALALLVSDAEERGAEPALLAWLDGHGPLPGFGHPLYPNGDIRATALCALLGTDPVMSALASCAMAITGLHPNIDFALVALTRKADLPPTAPFALFLLGRSLGWAAHAMEQVSEGRLIRPRAHYDGQERPP